MRILCPITVGVFLLITIVLVSGKGEQVRETSVARVPRALVLQPVSKLREEEDDGPLDWLANIFRGMVSPRKRQSHYQQMPMLGPIRIPGMDDEVYIKQLGSLANSQSRVVVRVMTQGRGQMTGQMPSATYYTYQPMFPVSPTRQVPVQSAGFVPMASPTPTAPWPQPPALRPHYPPNNYAKNMYPNYNYPPQSHIYHNQFRPMHHPHYDSSYTPRYTQNPYGTYDFDNSIPHGRGSRHGADPLRPTNYPLYPPIRDHVNHHHDLNADAHQHVHEIRNQSVSSEEVYDDSRESEIRYANGESKEVLTDSKVTDKFKEIYRPDRMVPTNPTWRNRFWTRTHKTTTISPTTKKSEEEVIKSTKDGKFSSTEIKEVVAPDLKDWKEKSEKREEKRTDSRMDEGEDEEAKEGLMLGKGESQEHMEKRYLNVRTTAERGGRTEANGKNHSRKRNNWKPIEPKSTTIYSIYSKNNRENFEALSNTEGVTSAPRETTPKEKEKEKGEGEEVEQSRRGEGKRPSKGYQRKVGKTSRRVRIVESVSSSVSVTSSKGKAAVKSKLS